MTLEAAGPACFTGSPERAAELAKARKAGGACVASVAKAAAAAVEPGYRNAKGRCVRDKRLAKECGPPPYLNCTAECSPAPKNCRSN